ncbi:MAG TPA: type II toxin-antitoxin system PemK/MazF family toxin [Pirellulales bacterium]|nr:type II toxin-antitoxin system PemK/MazF family toxin [Pirellulales bacterium]
MASFPQRSDLYWIPLEVEEDGDKERPIVVVSRDELNRGDRVLVVPFYSQQLEKRAKQKWCAPFKIGEGGLKKDCVAKGDEIQLIDPTEILWARGKLVRFNAEQMARVILAVRRAMRDPTADDA